MAETADPGGTRNDSASPHAGHGWWPYLLPYVSFLIAIEISRRTPEAWAGAMLVFKPAVPAALLFFFWSRGHYRELVGYRWLSGATALDGIFGLASAALWLAPFVLFASVREWFGVDVSTGFDPGIMGSEREWLALSLRLAGYALVTPLFEELFIRSFVMRVSEIYPGPGDFRDLALARFTWRSFIATTLIFTAGHMSWEWPVALIWVMATNAWFYWRGHLMSVVVVHGVANASILFFVVALDGKILDQAGEILPLWFFI